MRELLMRTLPLLAALALLAGCSVITEPGHFETAPTYPDSGVDSGPGPDIDGGPGIDGGPVDGGPTPTVCDPWPDCPDCVRTPIDERSVIAVAPTRGGGALTIDTNRETRVDGIGNFIPFDGIALHFDQTSDSWVSIATERPMGTGGDMLPPQPVLRVHRSENPQAVVALRAIPAGEAWNPTSMAETMGMRWCSFSDDDGVFFGAIWDSAGSAEMGLWRVQVTSGDDITMSTLARASEAALWGDNPVLSRWDGMTPAGTCAIERERTGGRVFISYRVPIEAPGAGGTFGSIWGAYASATPETPNGFATRYANVLPDRPLDAANGLVVAGPDTTNSSQVYLYDISRIPTLDSPNVTAEARLDSSTDAPPILVPGREDDDAVHLYVADAEDVYFHPLVIQDGRPSLGDPFVGFTAENDITPKWTLAGFEDSGFVGFAYVDDSDGANFGVFEPGGPSVEFENRGNVFDIAMDVNGSDDEFRGGVLTLTNPGALQFTEFRVCDTPL